MEPIRLVVAERSSRLIQYVRDHLDRDAVLVRVDHLPGETRCVLRQAVGHGEEEAAAAAAHLLVPRRVNHPRILAYASAERADLGASSLAPVRACGTRLFAGLSGWIGRCARPKGRFERSIPALELRMIRARQSHHARLERVVPARRVAVAVLENRLGYPVAPGELSSGDSAVGGEHVPVALTDRRRLVPGWDWAQRQARPDGAQLFPPLLAQVAPVGKERRVEPIVGDEVHLSLLHSVNGAPSRQLAWRHGFLAKEIVRLRRQRLPDARLCPFVERTLI